MDGKSPCIPPEGTVGFPVKPGPVWALIAPVYPLPPPRTFVPFIGAVTDILVYFAYNRLVFGDILPVRAATNRVRSQTRWNEEGGYSLGQNFQDILQISVFNDELLSILAIRAGLLADPPLPKQRQPAAAGGSPLGSHGSPLWQVHRDTLERASGFGESPKYSGTAPTQSKKPVPR